MNFLVHENPETKVEVFRAGMRSCTAYGLALEAAGIYYSIEPREREYAIVVAAADAARARSELEAYAEESVVPTQRTDAVILRGNGWIGALTYPVVLAALTALQLNRVFSPDWFNAGANNAGLVRSGDLWRPVTALTLHADTAHLISNMLFGGLIGLFVGQVLGSGLAWLSILLAGAAGNLVSALLRPPGHSSIGASTAVFAALGILAGYEWTRRQRLRATTLVKLTPILGGFILLSYMGTGGERTDVLSHVTGFLCGLALGGVYGKLGDRITFGPSAQTALGLGTVALLAISWVFALA